VPQFQTHFYRRDHHQTTPSIITPHLIAVEDGRRAELLLAMRLLAQQSDFVEES
jgi:hypothetical protein